LLGFRARGGWGKPVVESPIDGVERPIDDYLAIDWRYFSASMSRSASTAPASR
jgi:hypothetical protein